VDRFHEDNARGSVHLGLWFTVSGFWLSGESLDETSFAGMPGSETWQLSEVLFVSAITVAVATYPEGIEANSPGSATKERHPGLANKHVCTLLGYYKIMISHTFQGAFFYPS
jgi:hypothetical protein